MKTPLLDTIHLPKDTRSLSDEQLKQLADELRTETIDAVAHTALAEVRISQERELQRRDGALDRHVRDRDHEIAALEFCHRLGLTYVSCSPFRVPIARLAAAQAVLKEAKAGK